MADALTNLVSSFGLGLSNSLRTVASATDKTGASMGQLVDAIRVCASALLDLAQHFVGAVSAIPVSDQQKQNKDGGLGGVGTVVASITSAVTGAVGSIEQVITALQGFVQALNPSVIANFTRSIEGLQATIGVAFEPVFQILTTTFQEVAAIILPLMESLAPVVTTLVNNFAANLIPVVKLLVDVFTSLLPVIQVAIQITQLFDAAIRPLIVLFNLLITVLAPLFAVFQLLLVPLQIVQAVLDGISEILDVMNAVFKSLVQSLLKFLSTLLQTGFLKTIFDFLGSTVKTLITYFVLFIGYILKFLGLSGALNDLIESLRPKAGKTKAYEGASTKGFEQIAKDLALASATAAGAAAADQKQDTLNDVVKELEKLRTGDSGPLGKLFVIADDVKRLADFIVQTGQSVGNTIRSTGHVPSGSELGGALKGDSSGNIVLDAFNPLKTAKDSYNLVSSLF